MRDDAQPNGEAGRWRTRVEQWMAMGILVVTLGLLGFLVLLFDVFLAYSNSILFCVILVPIGLACSYCVYRGVEMRAAFVPGVVFAVAIVALYLSDYTPVKPFHRVFTAIEPGASREVVGAAVRREFPADGRYRVPALGETEGAIWITLDPDDGHYNAELIHVVLNEDRVVAKSYLPD